MCERCIICTQGDTPKQDSESLDVAFLFASNSGPVLRFARVQGMRCRCLATRKVEAVIGRLADIRASATPDNELDLACRWFVPVNFDGGYEFDGSPTPKEDLQYSAAAVVAYVTFKYDKTSRQYTLADEDLQLKALREQAQLLSASDQARAPSGVSLDAEYAAAAEPALAST
jgi:hypothetical protein